MLARSRYAVAGVLLATLIVGCALSGAGQDTLGLVGEDSIERVAGFSFPSLGKLRYNDEGLIKRATGVNIGLGYSVRYYTGDEGLVPEDLNSYWGWGTVALIIPYVEFGFSYPIRLGDSGKLLVIDMGLLYIIPYIGFTVMY